MFRNSIRCSLVTALALTLTLSASACGDDPVDRVPDASEFNPTPGSPGTGSDGGYGYGDGGGSSVSPDAVIHLCYRDADCAAFEICDLSLTPHDCVLGEGRCSSDADCDTAAGEKCDGDHYCAIDACEGVTCSNGGVCSTEDGQAVCNCPHGHSANGTTCEAFGEMPDWVGIQWADPWTSDSDRGTVTLEFEVNQKSETTIYGQVYWSGRTNTTDSHIDGWRMQLGVTTKSIGYPIVAGDFEWTEMTFNADHSSNNHEWLVAFPTDVEGSFNWIVRFTSNDGGDWIYADASPGFITSASLKPGTAIVGDGGGTPDVPVGSTCATPFLALSMTHPTNGSSQTGAYEFTITYEGEDDAATALGAATVTRNGDALDVVQAVMGNSGIPTLRVSFDAAAKSVTISESGLADGKYTWLFRDGKGCALYVPIWVEETRFDWDDSFLYQVMTDRFFNGDTGNDRKVGTHLALTDWMGGDHRGIIQKMKEGYFDDLSVNAIWISSPVLNTDGYGIGDSASEKFAAYHAYWPVATGWTDTNQQMFIDAGIDDPLDPHFGSDADLRELIQLAHSKGIRVLVDFVANHVFGISNPSDADGLESPLWTLHRNSGWFNTDPIKFCGDYTDGTMNYDHSYWTFRCWFNAYLADFDFDGSAEALKMVLDHAIWLAQEYDIDGFRLDAVKHMSMKFTTGIRDRIKAELETTGLTFYTVGETFDGNEANLIKWIGDDKLTGQFSFAFYYKILDPLIRNNGSYGDMGNGIAYLDTYFRKVYGEARMPNFMGNHDVERALQLAGGDHARLRRAQTVVMTSPEIPLIYQGDDIGMMGGADPDNRQMMLFDGDLSSDQRSTLDHLKKLARARKDNAAFRYGTRTNCATAPDVWVYKMERDGNTAVVGINRSGSEWSGGCAGASGSFTDVINGGTATGTFRVPAGGSAVYVVND